jgi:hypothetical protein
MRPQGPCIFSAPCAGTLKEMMGRMGMRKDSVRFVLGQTLEKNYLPALLCFSTPEEERILRAITPEVMRRLSRACSYLVLAELRGIGIEIE